MNDDHKALLKEYASAAAECRMLQQEMGNQVRTLWLALGSPEIDYKTHKNDELRTANEQLGVDQLIEDYLVSNIYIFYGGAGYTNAKPFSVDWFNAMVKLMPQTLKAVQAMDAWHNAVVDDELVTMVQRKKEQRLATAEVNYTAAEKELAEARSAM
jgi:hypothetical protein